MAADAQRFEGRLRPGTVQRIAHLAFVLVALVQGANWLLEALPRYLPKDWSKAHELDTFQDWLGARLYLQSIDPYSKAGAEALHAPWFGHPPTAMLWLMPIASLDKPIAAELMDLSVWLLLALHLYVCAREIRFPAPIALSTLLFGWALTTQGMVAHWHAIQSSEQIAFALVMCWLYLRRGRQGSAGIALGIAATFKVFPGVIYVFLLLARRFRAFVVASLALGIAVAITTAKVGLHMIQEFLAHQKGAAAQWIGNVRNASLHGAVIRLLSPVCVSSPVQTPKATLIATGIALLMLVGASLVSLRALRLARTDDPRAIDMPFALFTTIAVFINPWVWEHYWVLMIQPAFVVANTVYGRLRETLNDWLDETGSLRAVVVAALAAAVSLTGILAIAKLLRTQEIRTEKMLDEYSATKSAWAHQQLHLYEVFNTAPWVIMIVLCFMAMPFATPRARAHRVDAPAP